MAALCSRSRSLPICLFTLDLLAARNFIHIPEWFTMGGIDDARAILAAMLGCVSTVLALIFSVALLVLSKSAEFAHTIQRNMHLGRHRVLAQDLEFGVAQIVEIGIRALSPAINDTFTGIACVDLLGEALTILDNAPACSGRWYDSHGTLRLLVRPVIIPRLVKQAFDQIRQAAADNPAVLIRLLSTIGRLADGWNIAADRTALREQALAVWETAESRVSVKMDRDDIEAAWLKTRDLLDLEDAATGEKAADFPAGLIQGSIED